MHPGSKLSTLAWWGDTSLGPDLGIEDATTDEAYAAMDWLAARQDSIERKLAGRHLAPAANPARMALFDLSSSWLEGTHCPLGARGYSRDGKKGNIQIEYGLLTDPGRPVAVRVFDGNTADPAAFTEILGAVHDGFQLRKMVMVGDRGMITTARIEAIRELDGRYAWITALRAPAIRKLIAGDGPLQLSPLRRAGPRRDHQRGLPRRKADRLPQPSPRRRARPQARGPADGHREAARPDRRPRRRPGGCPAPPRSARRPARSSTSTRWPSTSTVTITDGSLTIERKQAQIDDEARLDGIYVIRTPVPADDLDSAGVVTAYKNLKHVERDFRHIKSDDLDLRPVFHRLEHRVKAHVLICMLAAYLTWHLRQAWAPLTYTDEEPPAPANPVAPAQALGSRRGQGLPPARRGRPPLPQLPRAARPPGHPHPQRAPLRRHPRRRPRPRRAHQRATPGLRAHRGGHPAHPAQVDRNRHQARRESAGQRRSRHPNHP